MVGSLTRVALARSGAGNSAEGTLVPFLLYRGLWAASTPGQGIGQIQQQACSIYMYLRAGHTLFNDSLLHLWGALWRYLITWSAFACHSHGQPLIRETAAARIAVVKKLI